MSQSLRPPVAACVVLLVFLARCGGVCVSLGCMCATLLSTRGFACLSPATPTEKASVSRCVFVWFCFVLFCSVLILLPSPPYVRVELYKGKFASVATALETMREKSASLQGRLRDINSVLREEKIAFEKAEISKVQLKKAVEDLTTQKDRVKSELTDAEGRERVLQFELNELTVCFVFAAVVVCEWAALTHLWLRLQRKETETSTEVEAMKKKNAETVEPELARMETEITTLQVRMTKSLCLCVCVCLPADLSVSFCFAVSLCMCLFTFAAASRLLPLRASPSFRGGITRVVLSPPFSVRHRPRQVVHRGNACPKDGVDGARVRLEGREAADGGAAGRLAHRAVKSKGRPRPHHEANADRRQGVFRHGLHHQRPGSQHQAV